MCVESAPHMEEWRIVSVLCIIFNSCDKFLIFRVSYFQKVQQRLERLSKFDQIGQIKFLSVELKKYLC